MEALQAAAAELVADQPRGGASCTGTPPAGTPAAHMQPGTWHLQSLVLTAHWEGLQL